MQDNSGKASGSINPGFNQEGGNLKEIQNDEKWAALQKAGGFNCARGELMAACAGTRVQAFKKCDGQSFSKTSGEIDSLQDQVQKKLKQANDNFWDFAKDIKKEIRDIQKSIYETAKERYENLENKAEKNWNDLPPGWQA